MGKMTGQRLTLAATGSWTAEHAYELEPLVEAVTERRLTAGGVSIDMRRIERLDTFGAWLVERLLRAHGGPRVTVASPETLSPYSIYRQGLGLDAQLGSFALDIERLGTSSQDRREI